MEIELLEKNSQSVWLRGYLKGIDDYNIYIAIDPSLKKFQSNYSITTSEQAI